MPTFEFRCKDCNAEYDFLTAFDKTGKWSKVSCPHCSSKKKEKIMSVPQHSFVNPIGTDRWNSDSGGHGYRFDFNKPAVKAQRAIAEQMSHMGTDPYGGADMLAEDIGLDVGIHDPETRKGLS